MGLLWNAKSGLRPRWIVAGLALMMFPASGLAKKTDVWIKNLTEHVLRLDATTTSRRLDGKHWKQLLREVHPGERAKVLWFDRRKAQPRRTTIELSTTVRIGSSQIAIKQKNYRRLAYTHLSQSVTGDRWFDDRNIHKKNWRVGSKTISVQYRAIHDGLADDIEYVFAGPDRPLFVFPVKDRNLIRVGGLAGLEGPFGKDHRPDWAVRCRDYNERGLVGGYCYPGHSGTDFMLKGGFKQMEKANLILAAAPGTVKEVVQEHYDKCRAFSLDNPLGVSCGGRPIVNNQIVIEHKIPGVGSYRSYYLHIKQSSAKVKVGQAVWCGTPIAEIGSAGKSSAPHLHFGVRFRPEGSTKGWKTIETMDPFKGKINPRGLWQAQGSGRIPAGKCTYPTAQILQPTAKLAPCRKGYHRGKWGRCVRTLREPGQCARGETRVNGRCQRTRSPVRLRSVR